MKKQIGQKPQRQLNMRRETLRPLVANDYTLVVGGTDQHQSNAGIECGPGATVHKPN